MTILNLTVLDINKPPKEVIIDKINAANSLQLSADDFIMSAPGVVVHPNYDTRVVLSPTTSSSWYQSLTAYYTRIKLQDVFAVNLKAFTTGVETTLEEILPLLNATYGIYLTVDDVEPAEIVFSNPAVLTSGGTVSIVAKPTSALFQGTKLVQINTNNVQGPVIYEDSQTYFAVLREEGVDTVAAYNSLGSKLDTFRFLDGAEIHASTIKQMIHWPNNDIMVVGNFDYSHTDSFNVTTRYQHKLVRMNSRGRLNGVSAAERFGVEFNLRYYPDTSRGFVYVLDATNQIGGNLHGLHRYNEDGTYDTAFSAAAVNAAPSAIQDMAIDADGNVFITYLDAETVVLKKLTPTGEDDAAASVVIDLAMEAPLVADMRASEDGVFIRLKMPVNRTKQNVISLDGVDLWDPLSVSTEGRWIEIVKVGLDMVPDTAFNPYHNDRGANALGIADQTKYNVAHSVCAISGFVAYIGLTVSPLSGFERPATVSLSVEDGRHQGITGHYYDDLHWDRIEGTTPNATREVMVWGTYRPLTADGFGLSRAAIALYSRGGDMPQTVVELADGISIRDVIAVAEETTSVTP